MDKDQFKILLERLEFGFGMWRNTAFLGYESNNQFGSGAEGVQEKLNNLKTPGWSFSVKPTKELGISGCVVVIIADCPEILDDVLDFIGRPPLMFITSDLSTQAEMAARRNGRHRHHVISQGPH
jgi:hypothetical protein